MANKELIIIVNPILTLGGVQLTTSSIEYDN